VKTHEIKCIGGCGTVLGTVELEEGETFKGDSAYHLCCDSCRPTKLPGPRNKKTPAAPQK
jgi:hypothetical protein